MGAGSRKTHGGELEGEVTHREGEKRSLGCSAHPHGEHLPRAGAQQRPSGGRPREMQLAESPKTFPKWWEGPWAPSGVLGIAWCCPTHGTGQHSDKRWLD